MRLRIFDINTPWFWFVMFYRRECGKPHISADLYESQKWSKSWLHVWKWEKLPDMRPMMPTDPMHSRDVLDVTKMCWPGNEPLA